MAGDTTFGDLHKMLHLYAPKVPPGLLKQFVNNSYSRALAANDWSELRGSGAIQLPAPHTTGTVSITNGSSTVTGSGTAFTSAHQYKQILFGTRAPFYDIESVDVGAQTLTLSQAYAGADLVGSTYTVQDIYIITPSDFLHYTDFMDMGVDWWTLGRDMNQEVLDMYDPRRAITGQRPVHLVNATPSPFTATIGRPRYELWPRPAAAQTYFFRYIKRKALLVDDDDSIIFPLRGDIIREGALADLSLWPGTEAAPNSYSDPSGTKAAVHDKRFQDTLASARQDDQSIRITSVQYRDEYKRLFPFPGRVLSTAAVTYMPGQP
ncbi:MAG: hypothetical protein JNM91_02940 [Flavobacteriales bacterium]|nr:hypothetical protein [Flavobacteriales bacterium]